MVGTTEACPGPQWSTDRERGRAEGFEIGRRGQRKVLEDRRTNSTTTSGAHWAWLSTPTTYFVSFRQDTRCSSLVSWTLADRRRNDRQQRMDYSLGEFRARRLAWVSPRFRDRSMPDGSWVNKEMESPICHLILKVGRIVPLANE